MYHLESSMGDISLSDLDCSDISWIMDSIDVESVLDRLNIQIVSRRGDQIWGYCPTHMSFTGREPSHPKWTINVRTGKTNCFTESRGSNLVYETARIRKISKIEAIEWILGTPINSIEAKYKRIKNLINPTSEPIREISALDIDKFESYIEEGELHSGAISLLAKNNILPKTALDFGCVEFTHGFYKDRLIFPIRNSDYDLIGFVATDVLGLDDWLKKNNKVVDMNTKQLRRSRPDDYRKVRYPKGFKVGKCLFGAESCPKNEVAILVEGCRDLMKLRQEGFPGTLGIGGTNLSNDQLLILSKLHPRKVVIMLDGDEGGERGTEKIIKDLLSIFNSVYITKLAKGRDPKDLNRSEILYYLKNKTEEVFTYGDLDLGRS